MPRCEFFDERILVEQLEKTRPEHAVHEDPTAHSLNQAAIMHGVLDRLKNSQPTEPRDMKSSAPSAALGKRLCAFRGAPSAALEFLCHSGSVRDKPSISISDAARKQGIASIKHFVLDTLDQEIGDLKAALILDYFLKEHGPTVYNQALADARAFVEEKAADLEGLGYQVEFPLSTAAKKK